MAKKRTTSLTQVTLRYPPHWFSPEDLLTLVELSAFQEEWEALGLTDKDLGLLQALIMVSPKGAPVIEGTGGLRKMRCGKSDKGKSSGYRVCYVYFEEFKTVLLVIIYSKSKKGTIPAAQKPAFRKVIDRIHQSLLRGPKRIGRRKNRQEAK